LHLLPFNINAVAYFIHLLFYPGVVIIIFQCSVHGSITQWGVSILD